VQETILDYEVIKLHNFVVQSYNELLILDCASNQAAQLRCTELHTSYAEMALDCKAIECRKQFLITK